MAYGKVRTATDSIAAGTGNGVTAGPNVPQSAAQQRVEANPTFQKDAATVYNDLNSGNYTGAWDTALSTSSMFGPTNMSTETTDPLVQALESSQGLESFDPSKKWNASSLDAYYNAFNSTAAYHGNSSGSNGYLGQNPWGDWGSASAITSGKDQAANIAQEGDTPDVARFAGQVPTHSFLSKFGAPIVTAVGDIAGAFVGDPMAGNQLVGTYDLATGNYAGALGNLASSFVPGAGSAVGNALNIGTVAGSALVGAGLGSAESELSGGNPLLGAFSGAASGAIGAGAGGAVGNALNIGTVAGSALVGAGVGSAESELSGGNPLLGALGGASSGAIGASGISGDVSNFVGGGFLGNALGSAAQGALRMGANIGVGMIGKGING